MSTLIAGRPATLAVGSRTTPEQVALILRPEPPLQHDQPLLLGEVNRRLEAVTELLTVQGGWLEEQRQPMRPRDRPALSAGRRDPRPRR